MIKIIWNMKKFLEKKTISYIIEDEYVNDKIFATGIKKKEDFNIVVHQKAEHGGTIFKTIPFDTFIFKIIPKDIKDIEKEYPRSANENLYKALADMRLVYLPDAKEIINIIFSTIGFIMGFILGLLPMVIEYFIK